MVDTGVVQDEYIEEVWTQGVIPRKAIKNTYRQLHIRQGPTRNQKPTNASVENHMRPHRVFVFIDDIVWKHKMQE